MFVDNTKVEAMAEMFYYVQVVKDMYERGDFNYATNPKETALSMIFEKVDSLERDLSNN